MPTRTIFLLGLIALVLAGCNLPTPGVTTPTARPTPTPEAITTPALVAAWVDGGNLMVWRTGDDLPRRIAVGGVIQPVISPDGQTIAFTRGPQGQRASLWVVDSAGTAERQIAGEDALMADTPANTRREIAQVVWAGPEHLLFNTRLVPTLPMPGGAPADDLWRVDLPGGRAVRLLADGAGGVFTPSPDGQWIALARSGSYSAAPGRLWLADLQGAVQRELLSFPAVATASEYNFYPEPVWLPDSSAVLAAIPPPELIYSDSTAEDPQPVALWELPISGEPRQRGTVAATLFGLPRWSPDGQWLTYITQIGPRAENRIALQLARGDGTAPRTLVEGTVGTLQPAEWGPAGFTYTAGAAGALWFGTPERPPERIPSDGETAYFPLWAGPNLLLYATAPQAPCEIRAYDLDAGLLTALGTVSTGAPVFDARLLD